MDELHGTFTYYEMRTKQENPVTKEESFKALRRQRKNTRKRKSQTVATVISQKTMKK
jgi:hypothetical protein